MRRESAEPIDPPAPVTSTRAGGTWRRARRSAWRLLRMAVRVGPGLFVCGDHRETASLQGALHSGRRAAEGVRGVVSDTIGADKRPRE